MSRAPLALLLALLLATALGASTFVTPPRLLLDTTDGPAPDKQWTPRVAASPDGFLVVWTTSIPEQTDLVVVAQRYSLDGNPLDPLPTRIGEGCYYPSAIWNGNGWFVYANCEVDRTTSERRVLAVRLSAEGKVVGEKQLTGIVDWVNDVSTNGTQFVILGIGVPHQWALWTLDADGAPVRFIPLWARNAFTYDAYVFPYRDTWIAIRNPGSSSGDSMTLERTVVRNNIAGPQEIVARVPVGAALSRATNGSTHLLVWKKVEFLSNVAAYWQHLGYVLLDAEGRAISQEENLSSQYISSSWSAAYDTPAAFWDGSNYAAVWPWFDGFGVTEIRAMVLASPVVTRQHVVLERYPTTRSVTRSDLAVGIGPTRNLLVWLAPVRGPEPPYANNDLVGRDFTSFDTLVGARTKPIGRGIAPEQRLRLAVDAEQTFAVWREGDAATAIIRGQVIGKSGRFTISDGSWSAESPAVERLGDIYLVAWREEQWVEDSRSRHRILARRYDRAGRPLEAAPILITDGPHRLSNRELSPDSVDVATDGSQFLVVWSGGDAHIRAARISPGGQLFDAAPIALTTNDAIHHSSPSVEWNGRDFFVAWTEDPSKRDNFGQINFPLPHYARAMTVRSNGAIGASFKLSESAARNVEQPSRFAVASNANEIVAAWTVDREPGKQSCTYAQRFALDGRPLESARSVRCTTSTGLSVYTIGVVDVAWDGSEWWIATANAGNELDARLIPLERPAESIALAVKPASDISLARSPTGLVIGYSHVHETQLAWRAYVQTLVRGNRERSARR